MFSIGIICVGLLGVAILIPLGGKLAVDGNFADRAARDGQNWVREFKIRGFSNPTNWVDASNTPVYYNAATGAFIHDTANSLQAWERSYCIDPRNVFVNGNSKFPNPNVAPAAINCPQMDRITLRVTDPLSTAVPLGTKIMPPEMVNDIFFSQDDLAFTAPKDPAYPASQVYFKNGGANMNREFDGALTWMATVTPKIEGLQLYRDMYTLSIIVFANRDSSMSVSSGFADRPDNERLANITFYGSTNGGFAGGDVQLTAISNPTDLKLRRGDWLMLSGLTPVLSSSGPAKKLPIFKWYRVLSAGEDPGPTPPQLPNARDITLHGPDWDVGTVTNTQAVIVSDVVAVYEKTIHLESTSLWTNN